MKSLLLSRLVVMSLPALFSMVGCVDAGQGAAARSAERPPPPALALRTTLQHSVVYAGDSLRVQVQLYSPREGREDYLARRAREAGQAATTALLQYVDQVPTAWHERLVLTLQRVGADGHRETALAAGAWNQWRIATASMAGMRIGNPSEEWWAPLEAAQFAPGHYVLSVRWDGKDAVDAAWLDPEFALEAPEVAFELRVPGTVAERIEHAERQTQEHFQAGRFREARTQGQEVLRLDPAGPLDPERIETYLLIARSSLALDDAATAVATYRMLLPRLPPAETNDMTVAVEQALEALTTKLKAKS